MKDIIISIALYVNKGFLFNFMLYFFGSNKSYPVMMEWWFYWHLEKFILFVCFWATSIVFRGYFWLWLTEFRPTRETAQRSWMYAFHASLVLGTTCPLSCLPYPITTRCSLEGLQQCWASSLLLFRPVLIIICLYVNILIFQITKPLLLYCWYDIY